MILIDKDKNILMNSSPIPKIFETEEEFDAWLSKLKNPAEDIKKFIVIKEYSNEAINNAVSWDINKENYILETFINPFVIESDTPISIKAAWQTSGEIEYSIDNGLTWTTLDNNLGTNTPEATRFIFKGNMDENRLYSEDNSGRYWTINGGTNIKFSGDLTSLLRPSGRVIQLEDFAFTRMFTGCSIVDASELKLPSTVLSKNCYAYLFDKCTSLVKAPKLPATKMAEACYKGMFKSCYALRAIPELPSTELATECYYGMFEGSLLTSKPVLPATTLANDCYNNMFGSATLTIMPELPAMNLAPGCYAYMFQKTTIPESPKLPAMTLAFSCYRSMFYRSNLTAPPALPSTTLAEACYQNMFYESGLTTAPDLPALKVEKDAYNKMFASCKSMVKTMKELPATQIQERGYSDMFAWNDNMPHIPKINMLVLNSFNCGGFFRNVKCFSNESKDNRRYALKNTYSQHLFDFSWLGHLYVNATIYGNMAPQ